MYGDAVPERWVTVFTAAVGGLTDVGCSPDGRLLLVASHQGRGLFDCCTGERVSRDSSEIYADRDGTIEGIGTLAGTRVPLTGLFGGGSLPVHSLGWSVDAIEGTGVIFRGGDREQLHAETEDLRAVGFTPAGDLIIATPSSVTLLRLDPDSEPQHFN
jgi:hypothetical protein